MARVSWSATRSQTRGRSRKTSCVLAASVAQALALVYTMPATVHCTMDVATWCGAQAFGVAHTSLKSGPEGNANRLLGHSVASYRAL